MCSPLLITFSSLSDINLTLKIGITITWSFTLRYVIATTSLRCWKKISYDDVTSVLKRNRSISRCKSNKKPTLLQYRVPTGLKPHFMADIWQNFGYGLRVKRKEKHNISIFVISINSCDFWWLRSVFAVKNYFKLNTVRKS